MIRIDEALARAQLNAAIEWANDLGREVPETWTKVTQTVASGPSKTLIAGLCTSLLAKATNADVDALAIKPEPNRPASFAMRPLCENVVVPASKGGPDHPPFHLGARGPQPTNNPPYYRFSHLDEVERRHRSGGTLDYLRDRLREANAYTEEQALAALAAFVRSRTEAEREYLAKRDANLPTNEDVHELLDALSGFLDRGSGDRPLRLQAVVGGLVRATGLPVSTQGITDPSRHAPGDVHVPDEVDPWWVAEVKGRPMLMSEAIGFLDNVREHSIPGAWIVVIASDHDPLDRTELSDAAREHEILLTIIEDIVELVAAVLAHPAVEQASLGQCASAIGEQLRAMNASGETLEAWSEQFSTDSASSEPTPPSTLFG